MQEATPPAVSWPLYILGKEYHVVTHIDDATLESPFDVLDQSSLVQVTEAMSEQKRQFV